MTVQISVACRNDMLEAWQKRIGSSAVLKIRTGSAPLNTLAPDTGDVLASIDLPDGWMKEANNGQKVNSEWKNTKTVMDGIPGHYRIYDAKGECHEQGSVTRVNGGGDLTLLTTFPLVLGQPVGVGVFQKTMSGA